MIFPKDADLSRALEFTIEMDKMKSIFRRSSIFDGSRRENDAEHSFHICIMALAFEKFAPEGVDLLRVLKMLIVHDVVEIDAGDTFAYDEEAKKSQASREEAAADRIFGMLPPDQQEKFRALWDEFEAGETPEAKFAHTMDNFQPIMLNAAVGGKGWSDWETPLSKIMKRNENTAAGSRELWDYSLNNFIMPHVDNGVIKKDI